MSHSGLNGIAFLDFDGCMHPAGCDVDIYFCHQGLLESWLRRRPKFGIVISSSWREALTLKEIRDLFDGDLMGTRIIGVAPTVRADSWTQQEGAQRQAYFERQVEVLRWLHENEMQTKPWVAFDDQPWLFAPACPQLVVCDGRVGLTERELELADRVLAGAVG